MRTHYCGDLTEKHIDKNVKLAGWVHRCRDFGGVIFIDLRDREGIVQVVCHADVKNVVRIAKTLHNEDVIYVEGQVQKRLKERQNPHIKTGTIEIIALNIQILNRSEILPFSLEDYIPVNEELRFYHRYLDLRRPEIFEKVRFRSKLTHAVRAFLDRNGFLDIETPILIRSTPEGARDYLVPSRVYQGKFYALPQSPQLLKQLLMISGVDRYYQLARCFRDEDCRADRQPEFTQIDIEVSFMSEEEIQTLIEKMIRSLFKKLLGVTLNAFPKMTHREAMRRYGSDKPDLRIPLELVEVDDLFEKSSFSVFAEHALNPESRIAALRLPNGCALSRKQLDEYTEFVKIYGAKGLAYIKVNDREKGMEGLQSSLLKFLEPNRVEKLLNRVQAQTGDVIFLIADKAKIASEALGALRIKLGHDCHLAQEGFAPLWVVEFPTFEFVDGRWQSVHHPFTAPKVSLDDLEQAPGQAVSSAFDLVINGIEVGGGSIRIHNVDLQKKIFELLGIHEKAAEAKFGFLLRAMKYGCPPHGGVGFGLDRLAMIMTGAQSIREVLAFPKTATAACPLTEAPSTVDKKQLEELGIKVIKN
ncbi:MAG: aspartate--tRNA ligase [Gammaproteobacteria bacterium]|nr:aspartate--tRNA ligase [Gammaproteobacteria bacterium]